MALDPHCWVSRRMDVCSASPPDSLRSAPQQGPFTSNSYWYMFYELREAEIVRRVWRAFVQKEELRGE